jgi:hypothetical protein
MKGLAAAAIAAAFAMPASASVICGGSVPVINTVYTMPFTDLPVTDDETGAFVNIAHMIVNNNTAGGFTMTVTSAYGGFNKVGIATVALLATGGNPFTAEQLVLSLSQPATSAIGTGATVATTFTVVAPGTLAQSTPVWTSGAQTTATIDYAVDMQAKWAAQTTLLAGYYVEKLTANLTAVL